MNPKHSIIAILIITFLSAAQGAFSEKVIAILPFDDVSADKSKSGLGNELVDRAFSGLSKLPGLRIVDSASAKRQLEDAGITLSIPITEEEITNAGSVLNADMLLIGEYEYFDGSVFVKMYFIDTKRSELSSMMEGIASIFEEATSGSANIVHVISDSEVVISEGALEGVSAGDRFFVMKGETRLGEIEITMPLEHRSKGKIVKLEGIVQQGMKVKKLTPLPSKGIPDNLRYTTLVVSSIPNSARITIDGVEKGMTPIVMRNIPVATYSITAQKDEYGDFADNVILEDDTRSFLSAFLLLVSMPPEDYSRGGGQNSVLIKTHPTNANVYMNDVLKGVSPVTLTDLREGAYKIKATKSGYESVEKYVVVENGKTQTAEITLPSNVGIIRGGSKEEQVLEPKRNTELLINTTANSLDLMGFYISPYVRLVQNDSKGFNGTSANYEIPLGLTAKTSLFVDGLEFIVPMTQKGVGIGTKYAFLKDSVFYPSVAVNASYFFSVASAGKYEHDINLNCIGYYQLDSPIGLLGLHLRGGAGMTAGAANRFYPNYSAGIDYNVTPSVRYILEYDSIYGITTGVGFSGPLNLAVYLDGGYSFTKGVWLGIKGEYQGSF